jgi:hypothetical protein
MRERMDFLLLLPRGERIVLEVDGKQHYAQGDTASPRLYSEMVSETGGFGYADTRSTGSVGTSCLRLVPPTCFVSSSTSF